MPQSLKYLTQFYNCQSYKRSVTQTKERGKKSHNKRDVDEEQANITSHSNAVSALEIALQCYEGEERDVVHGTETYTFIYCNLKMFDFMNFSILNSSAPN